MRPIVYPYAMTSSSAKSLAKALNTRRVWPDRNYRPRPNHLIINWGSNVIPRWFHHNILNRVPNVSWATNKDMAFKFLKHDGVPVPRFTGDCHEAYEWDSPVMVRSLLRSHSGRGAHYVDKADRDLLVGSLSGAPLYVEYIKKQYEYRIHVFNGRVIDVQQKRVRSNSEGNNWQIRSYSNGWVFTRGDIVGYQDEFGSIAVKAVQSLGLDFGAVDLIYNSHYDSAYVLEVNTAPGLEGTTLNSYVEAIKEIL